MERAILHCDLNNFYASVECLYNPQIRDKPVAVCGSQELRHGIVLAKNYIAKKYGIKTGEPICKAKNKCPGLIVIKPNYHLYIRFSNLAKEIYKTYTNLVEPFGIDECWLDVTESIKIFGDGTKIAYEIKDRIKSELGITASVGVSYNKIFAKLGSDMKKPDAVTIISSDGFKNTIWNLPVEDLLYVGYAIKRKLNKVSIYTIGDLANASLRFLKKELGKWGEVLWYFANGYDNSPVLKMEDEILIKGVGNSLTTQKDLSSNDEVKMLFYVLSESVCERLRRYNLKGKTVQISIKDLDLRYIERQGKLKEETYISNQIAKKAYEIFLQSWDWSKNIRALGVRVCDLAFDDKFIQQSIFDDQRQRQESLERCIDKIRLRFGHYSIQRALMLQDKQLNANPVEENIIYPTSYFKGGSL